MHVLELPRPRRHQPDRAPSERALTAPAPSRGEDLGAFVLQVRRALQEGTTHLVVDEAACAQWTPGQLLVLEHLRGLARRCGADWSAAAGRCAR